VHDFSTFDEVFLKKKWDEYKKEMETLLRKVS
jgi:hypothetical protein